MMIAPLAAAPLCFLPACPICQETLTGGDGGLRQLAVPRACGHIFHRSCLTEWEKTEKKAALRAQFSCPTCRAVSRDTVCIQLSIELATDTYKDETVIKLRTCLSSLKADYIRHETECKETIKQLRQSLQAAQEELRTHAAQSERLAEKCGSLEKHVEKLDAEVATAKNKLKYQNYRESPESDEACHAFVTSLATQSRDELAALVKNFHQDSKADSIFLKKLKLDLVQTKGQLEKALAKLRLVEEDAQEEGALKDSIPDCSSEHSPKRKRPRSRNLSIF